MPLILIVEDDHDLAIITEKYLRKERFETQIINDGAVVVDWVKDHQPSVILLDLMLPGKDGLTICQEINEFCNIPMIITTAKVGEVDRLIGFQAGADDYICKPYSPKEVVARVKVCLRRLSWDFMVADPVIVDNSRLTVNFYDLTICLTAIEFNLFRLLYDQPQRIFSRQNIIDAVYQDDRIVSYLTVNSHIRNLRKKSSKISPDHELIQSIYSIGYRYESVLTKESELNLKK